MSDPDTDRHWNGERWVYPHDIEEALNAAQLAIDEYHRGDRAWAEKWLLKAYEVNREPKEEKK